MFACLLGLDWTCHLSGLSLEVELANFRSPTRRHGPKASEALERSGHFRPLPISEQRTAQEQRENMRGRGSWRGSWRGREKKRKREKRKREKEKTRKREKERKREERKRMKRRKRSLVTLLKAIHGEPCYARAQDRSTSRAQTCLFRPKIRGAPGQER